METIGYVGLSGLWAMCSVAVFYWIKADKMGYRITPFERLSILLGPITLFTTAFCIFIYTISKNILERLDPQCPKENQANVE